MGKESWIIRLLKRIGLIKAYEADKAEMCKRSQALVYAPELATAVHGEKGNTMTDHMVFPHDWAVFLEDYSFRDNEEVYTNGARLIPTFRVEQMMGHYLPKAAEESKPRWIPVTERLPEEWVAVLVWSKCGFCETAVYLGIPGKWRVTWNHGMLDEDTITHWMPPS